MARAVIAEALTATCPDVAALKASLPFDASNRETERTALTHALFCPTCKPIADDMRRAQVAETDRLAAEAALEKADVCDKAAQVIETNGHCRRYLYDTKQAAGGTKLADCRVDIIGAINIAIGGTPRYAGTGLGAVVERALLQRIPEACITDWNDTKGRTKADAITLLRDTAAALREVTA